jgi:hypothetical protein
MLVDLKTASKKPAGVSSSHALQLTTYGVLADQAAAKVNPVKRYTAPRLYTITKTKTPAVVQQTVEITPEDRAYAEYIYPAVQDAARRGEVLPRRSSNLCSRKHCAYWQQCHRPTTAARCANDAGRMASCDDRGNTAAVRGRQRSTAGTLARELRMAEFSRPCQPLK